MKKLKNNEPLNLKDIMGDMEKLLETLGEINKTKLEDLDMDKITSKVNGFEEKYKNILPEESKNNLDSEE
jgi:hypothetical protein